MADQVTGVYNKSMQTVMMIVSGLSVLVLIAVTGISPRRTTLSVYELERRRESGNADAKRELSRELLLDDVLSILRIVEALLLVVVVLSVTAAFGLLLGVLISVLVALMYRRVAQFELFRTGADKFFDRIEPRVLVFIEHNQRLAGWLQNVSQPEAPTAISSREELEHLVQESGSILTLEQKKRIINGLEFDQKTVEMIMTPRSVVETVQASDVIGPLLLDELHRTGHSRFPVVEGDIDHVVGVLHIRELLTLHDKKSQTAEKAMEKHVYYINENQTLDRALAAFIKTRHHLFVVVNGYRETAGILTLEDCIEALLGHKIVDEYDVHDDLRIVAERNARDNNNPPHATNL